MLTAAQKRMAEQPTPAQIKRVTAALFAERCACHVDTMHKGWRVMVHDSFLTPGMLLVSATHPTLTGMSEEVADLDAARAWVGRMVR